MVSEVFRDPILKWPTPPFNFAKWPRWLRRFKQYRRLDEEAQAYSAKKRSYLEHRVLYNGVFSQEEHDSIVVVGKRRQNNI